METAAHLPVYHRIQCLTFSIACLLHRKIPKPCHRERNWFRRRAYKQLSFDLRAMGASIPGGKQFLRIFDQEDMISGLIRLSPGQKDTQTPHPRNELYLVLRGDGYLRIGDKNYPLETQKLYYVAKGVDHEFHGNTAELLILYFFGGGDAFPERN